MKNAQNDNVSLFDFNGHDVRVVQIDGAPWFAVTDVALALGYDPNGASVNIRNAADQSELRIVTRADIELQGLLHPQSNRLLLVSESGLYKFALRAQRSRPKPAPFRTG